ncbi:MAG: AAA domain-containing protein [Candidatus Paceibacterota bacterium]
MVRHLVEAAGEPYPNPPNDIHPQELDNRYHPREIFCPRSADSSQLAAVMAAAEGTDFILEGPPGTGKSQTIANIIANCLAHGKRVLFVAEKRAALDVVHRRLREEGLEPFCLELHSNKTGKGEVLAQFKQSLDVLESQENQEWEDRAVELGTLRETLNGYSHALHERQPCGLSAYNCLDYLLPRQGQSIARIEKWDDIVNTPSPILERARELSRLVQDRVQQVGKLDDHLLAEIGREDWSPAWAEGMLARVQTLTNLSKEAQQSANELRAWMKRPGLMASLTDLYHLAYLLETLCQSQPVGPAFVTMPWTKVSTDIDSWMALVKERGDLRSELAIFAETRLLALNLDEIQQKWHASQASWFLPKWIGCNFVRKNLQSARADESRLGVDSIPDTLQKALRLRTLNQELSSVAPAAIETVGDFWENGNPSPEKIKEIQTWGESLHSRLLDCAGDDLVWLEHLRQLLAALFREGPAAYALDSTIGSRFVWFLNSFAVFVTEFNAVSDELLLRRATLDGASDHLVAVNALIERFQAGWPHLRLWCAWQKVRAEALGMGLESLIEHFERSGVDPTDLPGLFERSFRRALLFAAIDKDPILKGFFGREHSERIEKFRLLDDRMSLLAREGIRNRLSVGIPREQSNDVSKSEIGLLRKELGKKMRHIPVRQLISRIPTVADHPKCTTSGHLKVHHYSDGKQVPV